MWKLCCGPSPVVQQAHQASEPAPAAPAAAAATATATTAPAATAAPKVDQNAVPMQEITPKPAEASAPVPEQAAAAAAVASVVPEVILSPAKEEEQPAPTTVAEHVVVPEPAVAVQENASESAKPNHPQPAAVESAKPAEPVQDTTVESSATPSGSKKPVVLIIIHSLSIRFLYAENNIQCKPGNSDIRLCLN
ncbi:hypothetical protein BJ741DRAFT_59541 [Chytriomyces cf. hyalinus JEL632]|nr:hypothetical protein BJ741DRAFT_59541 [Chytriomyces cf. hyalinus JEL632]